jgi:3',5'-cyclic AMP phosphodiesterase CpdA
VPKKAIQAKVEEDEQRDFVTPATWSAVFENNYKDKKAKYWRRDFESITLIALDTVNPYGGWQGSLDQEQFGWLKRQCEELHDRLIVITSHHPLDDLYNGYTVELTPRVLRESIKEFLLEQPNIVAWICGHTHQHKITHFKSQTSEGFWQIETASLIDWPQQGRVIEFYIDDMDQLCIATTLFDHQGSIASQYSTNDLNDVNNLAGLSRALSVNDWQRRSGAFDIELNEGLPSDQNVILKRALPSKK